MDENNSLKRKIILKEKENISKKKNIVDSHSCHVSYVNNVASSFYKNEIHALKKKIDCLSSNLSNYAFNHNRLESMFRKKQIPHMHAHPTRHTPHVHHDHTHSHMHARTHSHMHARVYHVHIVAAKTI